MIRYAISFCRTFSALQTYAQDSLSLQQRVKILGQYNDEVLNERFKAVGEWHTHSDDAPVPSITDVVALRTVAKHDEGYIESPVLLIIGNLMSLAFMFCSEMKCIVMIIVSKI